MAKLGDFGVRRERPADVQEELVTFGWFGAEIRCAQHFSQTRLMNLMESARTVDSEDPQAMVVVKDTLRVLIHPGDFGLFWSLAETEDQSMEDLAAVVQAIFQGMVKRPTQQQSDSSPGLLSTPASSTEGSVSPASPGPQAQEESLHRPDLADLLIKGQETKQRLKAAAASAAAAG